MNEVATERLGPRPPLLHRASRRQLVVIDLAIAGLVLLVGGNVAARSVGGNVAAQSVGGHVAAQSVGGHDALFFLVVLAAIAVALRRPLPRTSLVLLSAVLAVSAALAGTGGATPWIAFPLIAFPMFQVATTRDRRESLGWLALACALVLSGSALEVAHHYPGGGWGLAAVVAVAAWFVGDSVRVRRVYVAGLAEQAAERQRQALERAQRSVAEERLQIARELHDVVAHSLSVIAVQSGVGRHVIDANPAEAKRALAAVEATSRSALDELRRMLGVLRRDDAGPATLSPAPGIGRLGELVDQVRAAGVPVDLQLRSGALHALNPGAALSVYRVVQEALTNVVKHAGPATVQVEVRDEPGTLVIEVVDNGRGDTAVPVGVDGPRSGAHHGIVGMRERVSLFGGTLSAGSRPDGGFRVLARMSLDRVIQ